MVVVVRFSWVFVLNLSYYICKGFGMFEVVPSVFPPFFLFLKSPTMVCFFLFSPFLFIMGQDRACVRFNLGFGETF